MLSITAKKTFWGFLIVMVLFQSLVLPLISNAQTETEIAAVKTAALFKGVQLTDAEAKAEIEKLRAGLAKLAESDGGCSWYQFGCHMKAVLLWGLELIAYLIASVGGLLLTLAAGLVDLMVDLNINALTKEGLVTFGFGSSLNIVNLLFVLALIIIAFGTILRIEKYGMKQLLAKLIIAVILINFSLVIAGLLLDFSHVFTKFFLTPTTSINGQTTASATVSDGLGMAFQPQTRDAPTFAKAQVAANQEKFWVTILNAAFTAIFTWMMAIVVLGVAFMFLIRYFYVVILLILMPFAWFFWVVPEYSGLAKKWWDKFLEQVFFLPAAAFFIYLAIKLKDVINASLTARVSGINSDATAAFAETLGKPDVFQTILNQIIIGGILIGGLIAAQKMGIAGSAGAMGIAKWARGAAGKIAKAPVTRPTKATARGLATALGSRYLRWVPGAQTTANKLAGVGSRQPEIEDYRKANFANLTNDQFRSYVKTLPAGPVARNAVLAEAAKRKMIPEFSEPQLDKLVTAARQASPGVATENIPIVKEIFKAMPHMAPKFIDDKTYKERYLDLKDDTGKVIGSNLPDIARFKAIKDMVQKATTAEALNYTVKSLEEIDVVMSLSNAKLGAIAASGTDKQREAILNTFAKAEKLVLSTPKELEKYTDDFDRVEKYINANPGLQSRTIGPAVTPSETTPQSPPTPPTPTKP